MTPRSRIQRETLLRASGEERSPEIPISFHSSGSTRNRWRKLKNPWFPGSIFLPNLPIFLDLEEVRKTGLRSGPLPLVRLASERFFRAESRPSPTGGHLPQRKQHCSPPTTREAKDSRVEQGRRLCFHKI